MIADDSESIRYILKEILSIGKHEVICEAIDGMDAVEKFSEFKPEIMLLDLTMPKKDGLSVVKEVVSSNPSAKIIMVTGTGDHEIIDECMQSGALAHVSKPFDFDNVLQTISEVNSK